jgi:hypothetical protein
MDAPRTKKQQHKSAKEKGQGKDGPGFSAKHVRAREALEERRALEQHVKKHVK